MLSVSGPAKQRCCWPTTIRGCGSYRILRIFGDFNFRFSLKNRIECKIFLLEYIQAIMGLAMAESNIFAATLLPGTQPSCQRTSCTNLILDPCTFLECRGCGDFGV